MKTLSVLNPWAYLIVSGAKDIENRSWDTKYRGRLRIHVSGDPLVWPEGSWLPSGVLETMDAEFAACAKYSELSAHSRGYEDLFRYAEKISGVSETPDDSEEEFEAKLLKSAEAGKIPFVSKCIIGEATLADVVTDSDSPWAEPGQYHWILKDPEWYEVPELGIKGRLRLWES